MKIASLTSALLLAALAGNASATSSLLLDESFDNFGSLAGKGWLVQTGSSAAVPISSSTSWFDGNNTSEFTAQAGPDNSYVASNFATAGSNGFIDNFLFTPTFALEGPGVTLSFWVRGGADGFSDSFAVYGCKVADCSSITQVVADSFAVDSWTQYTVNFAGQGAGATGRFVFEYFGNAATSNYIGIDTVTVAAIPEPETYALMGLGLAALAVLRRRKSAA